MPNPSNGSPDAFAAELFEHKQVLMRVAGRYYRNREDREDVVQTVFMKALKNRASYEDRGQLKAWLCILLRNECLSQKRRDWRMVLPEEMPDSIGPDDPAAGKDLRDILHIAARALNPLQQQCLIRSVRGEEMEAIAEQLDVPVGTVKSSLGRARAILANFA